MADRTAIEWTEATWNPVAGCSKVSPGCAHCYAENFSLRFKQSPAPWLPANAERNVVLHPERLSQPSRWRRPRLVFVNSMSDLFHDLVPLEFIQAVFAVMATTPHHTFQILTKRHERLAALGPELPWPSNVWMGVSVENRRWLERVDQLRQVPAAIRFISAEPLLGPLDGIDLTGIGWLIAGGESGPRHRPVMTEWLIALRDECRKQGVPFFMKQIGGRTPKAGGRTLDGHEYSEMPPVQVLACT